MANIPKLTDLVNGIMADLESELNVKIPTIGKFLLRALSQTMGGKLKIYYLAIARVQKNIGPDTADPENLGGTLNRWGAIKLGRSPFPATQGRYNVTVTGQIGATVPAGTIFKSNDDALNAGVFFVNDNPLTLIATTGTLEIRALIGGLDSRLAVTDELTSTTPLLNIDDVVVVSSEVEVPQDAETTEQYRAVLLNAFRLEAQGGAATDYRVWAGDVQGVLRVYPYAKSGTSAEVDLFVEATIADSIDGKGTPSAALIQDVTDVIEFDPDVSLPLNERGRRPVTVTVNVLPITPKDVDIAINGSIGIDTATQGLIFTAVDQLIKAIRPFVAAADIPDNKNDILSINLLTFIIQDLLDPGQSFTTITLTVDSINVPVSILFGNGDIPILNQITYP